MDDCLFLVDCFYVLVYGNKESKLIIFALGGFVELVRIMRSYIYEKFFFIISRVFKVFFVDIDNKQVIVEVSFYIIVYLVVYSDVIC